MPAGQDAAGRSEKALSPKSNMNIVGESDGRIVPAKCPNNGGQAPAEGMEGRRPAKENIGQATAPRTRSRTSESSALLGVREVARRDKRTRFTALLHHVTPELLRDSYYALKREAAPGVDGVTWQEYGTDLEGRLVDLHHRIHQGTYRAQPSLRAYIPKADGRQRPLGLATVASYCVSYNDILGSEPDAIRVGNSLSQRSFDFGREGHAQAAARGTAHVNSSLTDPGVKRICRDPEAGGNLFHTQLARSEGLQLVDVVGVTDPLN